MSHRLEHVKERIDNIEKDIPLLNLIPRDIAHTQVESSWRETHSFVLTSEIFGREENKEEIIGKLLSSGSEESLSVVAVVGIGGLGKTTLAQLVYNDERVVNHFEPKIWVCLSDDSGDGFDVNMWIKKILKSMNVRDVESLMLNGLKDELHEKISQKRYLLVLDDVWNENPEKWDNVRNLLMVGATGSKIVVTTRKTKVASIMGDNSPISLEGLEQNQSWNLFSKIAFREGRENVDPKIVEIGEEIAKMCKGVPLIIKTLARILQFKREEWQWLSIKNNENVLSLRDGNIDSVLSVLKLSYYDLPTHLRQCFAYCALFPKDYEIEKRLLIQLWIAQDYILSTNENEPLEDMGDQYFEELLSRSLLEKVEKDDSNNRFYKMHDLIHDLAQSIIGSDVLILRDGMKNIPEKIHHVSLFEGGNPMTKALKAKPIRTFLDFRDYYFKDDSIINQVIPSFKYLRMLSLNGFHVTKVPKSLGKLSHLRYLDLSNNGFEVLPNAITRLKNLQTLKLNNCWKLKRFPKLTRELINLRHLENYECDDLSYMPCGIGELTLIQSLPLFVVGNEGVWPGDHKIGSLSELRRLDQLRGELYIKNLQNVRDAVLVSKEDILKGKLYLQSLRLEWNGKWLSREGRWEENGELVMESLQPHPHLKELIIRGYGGRRFPSWMMNDGLGSLLRNVCYIEMWKCSRCQILPPFSQLPALKSLKLDDMDDVENVREGSSATPFFPSLQFLRLQKMAKLKGLWGMELVGEQGLSFLSLSELYIDECSSLTSIPLSSSPSLSRLKISHCHSLTALELQSSPCLSQLRIYTCHNLKSLKLQSTPCLSQLGICKCRSLTSLELQSSPCLSQLVIQKCPNLTSLELHSSPCLSQLRIYTCHNLKSLELQSTPCLSQLGICKCPSLTSLELQLSPYLSKLEIRDCLDLTSLELHSSPCLSTLSIRGCSSLASFKVASLPCLKNLLLERVREEVLGQIMFVSASSSLKFLSLHNIDDMISLSEELLQHLPTLHTLSILNCSHLATLPHSIGSLSLEIHDCPNLLSLELWSSPVLSELYIKDCSNLTSLELQSSPCLSELEIRDCLNLTSLELQSSPCLSTLKIRDCPNLASLRVASLPCLEQLILNRVRAEVLRQIMFVFPSSLKSLSICNVYDMISLPEELLQHVSTLQTLRILNCSSLAALPHWTGSLTSLTQLMIYKCPELTSLPEEMCVLKNLQNINICSCPHLEKRCREKTGEDWPKIAHIPRIHYHIDEIMEYQLRINC